MKQPVASFVQDEHSDWVAVLECGHRQHVRHKPPLVERPWVLSDTGRQQHIGMILNCKICDEQSSEA